MSDFEDDLSESEVSQNAPPKKQGMNLPKVSTPVILGAGLLALLGSVGVWFALNSNPAPVPDPITQTQPITTPSTTTPTTTPSTTSPPTTAPTTASGTGVEAGNIPLIADQPKPTTVASSTKPTAKPAIKPAPKPAAPRVVNPFAPLPQSNSTAVAVVNSGNQGGPAVAVFNPQPQQPTIVRPTAAPQVIRTPIVSSPFAPRPTNNSGTATAMAAIPSGTSTAVKPIPVVVAQQRPVIPKVLITKTPQTTATTPATAAARPPITGLVARPAFSVTPQILSTQPRPQAPIQATTPTNTNSNPVTTTNSTTPATTPSTTAATQTPTPSTTRPAVSEPPVFKIEPAPVSRPTSTPPATTTPTNSTQPAISTTPTTPTTNTNTTPATQPSTTTPATQPNTNTTPATNTNTTPVTQPSNNTTPANTNTTPTTNTNATPTTPTTQPNTNSTSPTTNPPANPTTTTTPSTPSTTTPETPANPNTTATTPNPSITTPTIPAAPTADLIELRRVVQEDLRLEYAGFSIGTVKKAFFQSSRGLLSIAEGDPLIRDSSVILKSVSPTEVVLALGNELLTLPLVKR